MQTSSWTHEGYRDPQPTMSDATRQSLTGVQSGRGMPTKVAPPARRNLNVQIGTGFGFWTPIGTGRLSSQRLPDAGALLRRGISSDRPYSIVASKSLMPT